MTKKTIRLAMFALTVCTLMLLSGCQLAREENHAAVPDRFMGISALLQTEKQFSAAPDGEYVDRAIPHDIDGTPLYLEITQLETGEDCMGINSGDWFTDIKQHFRTADTDDEQSESLTIEATMYICAEEMSFFPYLTLERVYQRTDGTLYAVDCGCNYAGSLDGLSLSMSESRTVSAGEGSSVLEATEIKLHVRERLKADEVRILAMRDLSVIESFTVQTESEIYLPAGTEWVLIEEVLSDGSILRTAYNEPLDDTAILLYTVCENGVFLPQPLTLHLP